MKFLLALALLLSPGYFHIHSAFPFTCTVSGNQQTCNYTLVWDWAIGTGAPTDGFVVQEFVNGSWHDTITQQRPGCDACMQQVSKTDGGGVTYTWRIVAYNVNGRSDPSNTASIVTPLINTNLVSITTNSIVTVSRRATDTSTIIAILVNANTVIGPGGFDISYPANMTLTVSRRATDTSSVMAILVNKSNVVMVNGVQQ